MCSVIYNKSGEFTRRIPDNDWNRLLQAVQELQAPPLSAEELDALKIGLWDHPIFKQDEWPLLALRAHLAGQLDERYLAKLLLFRACQSEGRVETFQLLDRAGNVDRVAKKVLKEELGLFYRSGRDPILSPPNSQFFRVTHPAKTSEEYALFESLIKSGTTPGLRRNEQGGYVQLILPMDLLNTILRTGFGGSARKGFIALGMFLRKERLTAESRVVSLAFDDWVRLPQVAHGNRCTPLQIYQHDAMYHLWLDSANIHRDRWRHLAQIFNKEGLEEAARRCLDGDFPAYAKALLQEPKNREGLFWNTLLHRFILNSEFTPQERTRILQIIKTFNQAELFKTLNMMKECYRSEAEYPEPFKEALAMMTNPSGDAS